MIFTDAKFWSYAAERAIKTAAQTAVAVLGAGMVSLLTIDFASLVAVAGGAALLSVFTSVAGYKSQD